MSVQNMRERRHYGERSRGNRGGLIVLETVGRQVPLLWRRVDWASAGVSRRHCSPPLSHRATWEQGS